MGEHRKHIIYQNSRLKFILDRDKIVWNVFDAIWHSCNHNQQLYTHAFNHLNDNDSCLRRYRIFKNRILEKITKNCRDRNVLYPQLFLALRYLVHRKTFECESISNAICWYFDPKTDLIWCWSRLRSGTAAMCRKYINQTLWTWLWKALGLELSSYFFCSKHKWT